MEIAHLTDDHHPFPHVLLGVRGHVVGPKRRLHVKHELKLNTLPIEAESRVHLLHHVEIDDALALPAADVGEVFEEELSWELALLQCEPPSTPSLEEKSDGNVEISMKS